MGKETLKFFDPYIDYSIGKMAGWNPRNPWGYSTQAGIAAHHREQQAKRDAEQRATSATLARRQATVATPFPIVHVDPKPCYPPPSMIPSITLDDYWQESADAPDCNYTGGSGPGLGPLRPQWWLDTGAFSAWEDFGDGLAYPSWGMRIGFGIAAGFVAVLIALVNSWPGPGTLFAVLAGGIAGMITPVPLGHIILALRTVAGHGLAALAWLMATAAVGLVVILGVRAFASKPAAAQPVVSYSSHAAPSPVHRHHRKGKHHVQASNQEDPFAGWTPPSEKAHP